jgi:hypothetical protein
MKNEENMEARHWILVNICKEGMKCTQPFSYPMGWVASSGLKCFLTYLISRGKRCKRDEK